MNQYKKPSLSDIKTRANGHWRGILVSLGIEERYLRKEHGPCPACGGTDRFRFHDNDGNGGYFCSPNGAGCGAGDGFALLQKFHGWNLRKCLEEVAGVVGSATAPPPILRKKPSPDWMRKLITETVAASKPIAQGDPVHRYLSGRGIALATYRSVLLTHSHLPYFEKQDGRNKVVKELPAMVALVHDKAGQVVALHRTYLTSSGAKANVREVKKLLNSGIKGAAVRLFDVDDQMGIAEGIETALAAHLLTGIPTWSAIDAGNMVQICIPDSVKRVHIFADADANFAGQAAAFTLARRLVNEQREAHVHVLRRVAGRCERRVYSSTDLPVDFADAYRAKLKLVA